MSTPRAHPFFGELREEAGLLIWAGAVELGGRAIPLELECEADVSDAQLDAVAAFPRALARYDALARQALELDEDEDGVPAYVEHHVDRLPDAALARVFACQRGAITRDRFLARLVLHRVWFVPEDDDAMAVFDYSIDPESTPQVLAVRFDAAGNLASIACES